MRRFAIIGLSLLGVSGCTSSPSSPDQTGGNVTFRTAIDNSIVHTNSSSPHGSVPGTGNTVDSIEVTSAGFFVSNMLFFSNTTGDQTDPNRTETILRTDHFILDFESWGKQYIGARDITPSTYRSIRFTMQAADANTDSLSVALGPVFNTFFASAQGSTVVIRGNIWANNQKMPFEYRSQLNGNELAVFDAPFTTAAGDLPKEVDVQLKTFSTFSAGSGMIMDPRDPRNAVSIDANLRSSLKASSLTPGS
ncbi:MAG: hypothetical protein ACHQM6_02795 [Candidatus Kapaibacterium sp.]